MIADYTRYSCEWCQHYDDTAYAFENHHASGRICEHRNPYEPDLSPYRNHPRFPYVTHAGSCCKAFTDLSIETSAARAEPIGKLFL